MACLKRATAWASLTALVFHLSAPLALAIPSQYQNCVLGRACIIGEFLYHDDYTPIPDAACSFDSRDPDGGLFWSNEPVTGTPEGWYAKQFDSTGLTQGVYPTTMCCVVEGERMCIDKTFTVNRPELTGEDINSAVWDAPTSNYNTPGTFGELLRNASTLTAQDIWSYSGRTLTNFGSLVSDIWSNAVRTLTGAELQGGGSLSTEETINNNQTNLSNQISDSQTALSNQLYQTGNLVVSQLFTNTNELNAKLSQMTYNLTTQMSVNNSLIKQQTSEGIESVKLQLQEQRNLLEALINEPVVTTFIEEGGETPDLSEKLKETKLAANAAYASFGQAQNRLKILERKWTQLSNSQIQEEVSQIIKLLEGPEGLWTRANWLNTAWGTVLTGQIYGYSQETLTAVKQVHSHAAYTPASALGQLKLALTKLELASPLLGEPTDEKGTTLFAYIKEVEALAEKLNYNSQAVEDLLSRWQQLSEAERSKEISKIKEAVLATNRITGASQMIDAETNKPENKLKNQLLGLQAVNGFNRQLLAANAGTGFQQVYLQEGSIIFRALAYNPSERISQKVAVKYALPKELAKEEVLEYDKDLTLEYEPESDALVAAVSLELKPLEAKLYSVFTQDIWILADEELDSYRKQSQELLKPLEKTAYAAQGTTLKSEIESKLDNLRLARPKAVSPADRIKFYREAQIELVAVKGLIVEMQDLVTQASAQGSLAGFIGGVSAIAVWGLVVIIVAGFVFLSMYMRILRREALASQGYSTGTAVATPSNVVGINAETLDSLKRSWVQSQAWHQKLKVNRTASQMFNLMFIALTATILSATVIGQVVVNTRQSEEAAPAGMTEASLDRDNVTVLGAKNDKVVSGIVKLKYEAEEKINLYTEASEASSITARLDDKVTEAVVIQEKDGMVEIEIDREGEKIKGWIVRSFLNFQ